MYLKITLFILLINSYALASDLSITVACTIPSLQEMAWTTIRRNQRYLRIECNLLSDRLTIEQKIDNIDAILLHMKKKEEFFKLLKRNDPNVKLCIQQAIDWLDKEKKEFDQTSVVYNYCARKQQKQQSKQLRTILKPKYEVYNFFNMSLAKIDSNNIFSLFSANDNYSDDVVIEEFKLFNTILNKVWFATGLYLDCCFKKDIRVPISFDYIHYFPNNNVIIAYAWGGIRLYCENSSIGSFTIKNRIKAISCFSDNKNIAVVSPDQTITIFDLTQKDETDPHFPEDFCPFIGDELALSEQPPVVLSHYKHSCSINHIKCIPNTNQIVFVDDFNLYCAYANSLDKPFLIATCKKQISSLVVSDKLIAYGLENEAIKIIDISTKELKCTLFTENVSVKAMDISRDNQYIIAGLDDERYFGRSIVYHWNIGKKQPQLIQKLKHKGSIRQVEFSPNSDSFFVHTNTKEVPTKDSSIFYIYPIDLEKHKHYIVQKIAQITKQIESATQTPQAIYQILDENKDFLYSSPKNSNIIALRRRLIYALNSSISDLLDRADGIIKSRADLTEFLKCLTSIIDMINIETIPDAAFLFGKCQKGCLTLSLNYQNAERVRRFYFFSLMAIMLGVCFYINVTKNNAVSYPLPSTG